MARDTITALNMEVMMPIHSTTAKPRIGPEPSINSAKPAIKVVMLESTMVSRARS